MIAPTRVAARHAKWHAPDVLARQIDAEPASFWAVDGDVLGPVAHAFAAIRSDATLAIDRVYVRKTHQRQRLATRRLAQLISVHPAAERAHLTVTRGTPAVAFYRHHGFDVAREIIDVDEAWRRTERFLH